MGGWNLEPIFRASLEDSNSWNEIEKGSLNVGTRFDNILATATVQQYLVQTTSKFLTVYVPMPKISTSFIYFCKYT